MFDSLRAHGLQHARLPCPSLSPRVCSNSCTLSWWCHPTISSSVIPFSSHLQFFPASGCFPMSQFFTSNWSFNFSISPSNEYSGLVSFRIDWFDLLAVQWTLKSFQNHNSSHNAPQEHQFFMAQLFFYGPTHIYMNTRKTIALTICFAAQENLSLLLLFRLLFPMKW